MRGVSLVLMFYATSMLFYGSVEMVHDFLHQLAALNISALHSHDHHEHHSMRDHEHGHNHDHHHHHGTVSHHHHEKDDAPSNIPFAINFFLFAQSNQEFKFHNPLLLRVVDAQHLEHLSARLLPPTPPPEVLSNINTIS
ncbi:hypothetical protein [Pseudochryseolinea flava]|uniref:hypothetical protein n=1 Tax=Pseudochryseolinea flava TaxID=2059302 RepID=UPI001C88C037|nr:hypothetical protein [Pseudochryseolinea flava]